MVSSLADKRSINRVICSLLISNSAGESSLGQVEDISLDGIFVKTGAPLPVGSILPVVIKLGDAGPEIRPNIAIVRHTRGGFGARFDQCSPTDARKLRRYIADINEIANRQSASLRSQNNSLALREANAIIRVLSESLQSGDVATKVTIISSSSRAREEATLSAIDHSRLLLTTSGRLRLNVGDTILALHTHKHASYSFEARVENTDRGTIHLTVPTVMYYSERRGDRRLPDDARAQLVIRAPWLNNDTLAFPVLERSSTGLSIRVNDDNMALWPGTPLPGAVLRDGDADEDLPSAVIKNVTTMKEPDGGTWLRVGVATGLERTKHAYQEIDSPGKGRRRKSRFIRKALKGLFDRAQYLYHKNYRKVVGKDVRHPSTVITFANAQGQSVVSLLNLSFQGQGPVRGPLVIIAPGFAGRKETFSPLAMTLIHNARLQNRELAVLRLDGTNNLGESEKSPGCEADGKHCIKYTLSGCVSDLLGAIKWSGNNELIDPTDIVLISSSLSSIAARKAMTRDELKVVSLWLALMGPPDGAHPVANAMGNSDPYGNYQAGIKNGIVTLFGCLVDGDFFCKDMDDHCLASLADSRADMAKISADVTWIVGKNDAFIDPRRVEDVMSVKAPGKRRILAMDSGHLPRSSDEAMEQFRLLTAEINQHIYGSPGDPVSPSLGLVAAVSEWEWSRIRKERGVNDASYWRDYLLGAGGIGYDVWSLTPEYQQLMADQSRLLDAANRDVLDVGAGTGNASAAVASTGPRSIVALDLVQEALDRTALKVAAHNVPLKTFACSADGNARTAVRRWLRGDLSSIGALIARFPPWHRRALRDAGTRYTDQLHGILRGGEDDLQIASDEAGLSEEVKQCLTDIQVLARLELGRVTEQEAERLLTSELKSNDIGSGLPFPSESFDRVISSLVLSYMRHPDDSLSEIYRVLKPGGVLVLSSMKPDAEGSQVYVSAIERIKQARDEELPPQFSRQELLDATHRFLDHATDLVRMEEEGLFHFWNGPQLLRLVRRAGFQRAQALDSFGNPAQAVIVVCFK